MSALEKLGKALEALKILPSPSVDEPPPLKDKEKVSLCVFVADMICSPETRAAPNFASLLSYSMEILLQICDDPDSNIRMTADECLNRIIRTMMDSNIVKVHVELHKEIKKNGSARSLRAALYRFAELAHLIRPNKGKLYIQNLVPCLINIAKRKEESVLETLAASITKILATLGNFTTDKDITTLLQVFLANISSENAVVRRTAATSILSVCLHCPKTQFFLIYTLNTMLELVLPVKSDESTYTILGVLNCIRGLLGHLNCEGKETIIRGSFGTKRKDNRQAVLSADTLIQVYELCLNWTHHSDHNIVTAALETLNQLLSSPPPQLLSVLLSSQGLSRSRIQAPAPVKLSSRTLSDMSVASTLPLLDESTLLDSEEAISNLSHWLPEGSLNYALSALDSSRPTVSAVASAVITVTEEGDTESESLGSEDADILLKSVVIEPTIEPDITICTRDSPSPPPIGLQPLLVWDIGDVADSTQCTLIYCARRLVTAFLIPDYTSVRVSVRALAIGCLSQVLRLYPQVFSSTVDINGRSTPEGFSHISDVLCFSFHADQQLRGLTRSLIGNLIQAKLEQGWDSLQEKDGKPVSLQNLIQILLEGLQDESSICVRHTLGALSNCLSNILESNYHSVSKLLLEKLLQLAYNPYWLIKVKLAELMCTLSYQSIYYITEDGHYQIRVIQSVILVLLGDQDNRVRKSAAEGICRLVENLYFPVDYGQDDVAVARATYLSRKMFTEKYEKENGQPTGPMNGLIESMTENTLSRLVQVLSQSLLESSSKYLTYGCIEALALLSDKYPPTTYPLGWQCHLIHFEVLQHASASNGLMAIVLALLMASPISLDLETHQWLLNLAGNLLTGLSKCVSSQRKYGSDSCGQMWSYISDKKLAELAENLLQHVMRLLYIFVRILEDITNSRNVGSSPLKRRPTRGTSPNKQTPMSERESLKEEKGRTFGNFSHIPHCVKLFEIVRSAYTNYRISLDSVASEKFLSLIHCVLNCLEKLLCEAGAAETSRIAEEILQYLRVTFILDSTATVRVVNQLLKSLFEAKLGHNRDCVDSVTDSLPSYTAPMCGFYSNVILLPLQNLIFNLDARTQFEFGKGSAKSVLPEAGKVPNVSYDREALAANIKLFEPIVIQALKEYTITSNVRLQVQVLRLLTQLVQLKVNYCLLDSDQIFIKFVLGQFEYLEEGQVHHAELLIPQIFKFLVHLSNEKNHSKPVISVPQVIQLCDGLMASGQNPITHCIPALLPIVEHVFLLNSSATSDIKELETQREVLLVMLLRLAEYPQVVEILYKVMKEGWRWEEHWKRWYRQTTEVILPLLAEARLLVDDSSTLHRLLNLNCNFTAPLNSLLWHLFIPQQEGQLTVHWLGMVATIMLSVCTYKEERILLELEQLNLYVREEGDDPLNVKTISKTLPPQSLMGKLILRVIKASVTTLNELRENVFENEKSGSLEKLLANFILCTIHISQPGNFDKVTKALKDLLHQSLYLQELNDAFIKICEKCPILTILWAHLLMLLNQGDRQFWAAIMSKGIPIGSKPVCTVDSSLNVEVVKRGSILLYCEYLSQNPGDLESFSWFLKNYVYLLVWNCQESPVEKLLCSTYNLDPNSKLLLDALSNCVTTDEPVFTHRMLHALEYIHSNYTGAVLMLVATSLLEHWNIALARLASAFCTRILAYMLTLDSAAVLSQLPLSQLVDLLRTLTTNKKKSKRHSGLICLLNKLGSQFYALSSYEGDNGGPVNALHIRSVKLDRAWVLSQVKDQCCEEQTNGRKCARLLSELEPDDIMEVFSSSNFDVHILKHCFILGSQFTLEECLRTQESNPLDKLSPLYTCTQAVLLNHVDIICSDLPIIYQVYNPSSNKLVEERSNPTEVLFMTSEFKRLFFPLVPAVKVYLSSVTFLIKDHRDLMNITKKESLIHLAQFGILCIEMGHWLIRNSAANNIKHWPSLLQYCLECSAVIFQFDVLSSLLTHKHILSVCIAIFYILKVITGEETNLKSLKYSSEGKSNEYLESVESCLQIATLFSWIENHMEESVDIPAHMYQCIRSIVISIGRIQKVNWFCRIPVEAWQIPVNIECPPPLPIQLLHDTDTLRQIVSRICMIGWTGRLQFEETWVCLLSALSPNPDIDASDQEEISVIMQANSIAVDGITWLVLSTLALNAGNPNTSVLFHIPRHDNSNLYKLSYWKKLEGMNESLCWRLKRISSDRSIELIRIDRRPNIERGNDNSGYSLGQLSVSYLQTQITPAEERESKHNGMNAECAEREKILSDSGIDIRSCTQFLLDLFSQWTLPNSGISLNLQLSMVRSVLSLSDMFSEETHFTWMLNTFLDLSKNHPQHDEVLHQYLVIGICKATAVLNNFEGESAEKVIKVLESALKNQFPPMRLAGIHGLLYLLQSVRIIKKSWANVDNAQKFGVQDFRQKILQITLEYISKYCNSDSYESSEDVLLEVALVIYVLEYFYYEVPNTQAIVKFISQLIKQPVNNKCYQAIMQGLERLVLSEGNHLSEQITRLALDRFSQSDPCITLPGLQLLISCIYSGQHLKAVSSYNSERSSWTIEMMEKTSALFDRIRKGYPVEVELVCEILPRILADFFPASDILTKVIGEFLSPNQPHRRNMAAMVFQVFTQACCEQQLPLLQDWVVHSLGNFTRNHPVVMAVWSLCCFFISASTNQWLRAVFPHVQSRIGQCDYEDRHLLCIAALDFYQQLSDSQKAIFIQSFKEASSDKTPFIDVIACL